MASLTHVCLWDNKGWRRISAEEAARRNPYTVSAYSHLFMCELCGQYVTLANGQKNAPHFRHSSAELDKSCEERTVGAGSPITYQANIHETPIRIVGLNNKDFTLELGFVRIPDEIYDSRLKIEIKGSDNSSTIFVYSAERLFSDRTTYLSVGNNPCRSYSISLSNCSETRILRQYWPKKFTGVEPSGAVFSTDSKKKLPHGADVIIGKHYYVLQLGEIPKQFYKHVTVRQICRKPISGGIWFIYDIVANDYSEESAKFFLNYHCLLTDNPISMVPIWPECIREPYIIKHDSDAMVLLVDGNYINVHSFPQAIIRKLENSVIEVTIKDRQQLVSAGRGNALQYSYYWREPLDRVSRVPNVQVTDINGKTVYSGENRIPKQNTIVIKTQFDGFALKKSGGSIVEKIAIPAQSHIELFDICEDMKILVYVGMDLVWKSTFVNRKISISNVEGELLANQCFLSSWQLFLGRIHFDNNVFILVKHEQRDIILQTIGIMCKI